MLKMNRSTHVSLSSRSRRLRRNIIRGLVAGCLTFATPLAVQSADIEVVNTDDNGDGSLRQAIANAEAGDRIVFNIAGGGTINLASDLPEITDNLSFANQNVAAVIIDRQGRAPLSVTGGIIDLGELQVMNSGGGLVVDIELSTAATLIGNDEQITANVQAAGTIAPGDSSAAGSIGELIIDGDLDASDATIQVDVNGAGSPNDLVQVSGNGTVTDATLRPNFMGSNYSIGDTFTVFTAGTGLTGTLANSADVFQLSSNPFLEAIINSNPNDLQLLIQDNGESFTTVLQGCGQMGAVTEIDRLRTAGTVPQMNAISSLRNSSTLEINQAVGQLAGAIYPSLVDAEINEVHNSMNGIRDRVLLQQTDLGTSGHWSPWVRGYGMTLDTGGDACMAEGYRRTVGGIELGTGYLAASGLGVHGFAQLGACDTEMNSLGQGADTDSYRFGGTVQYVGDYLYGFGSGGFGIQEHSIDRSMSVLQPGTTATSESDGTAQFASVELGTVHRSEDWLWLSFVSLQGVQADLDGETESGDSDFRLTASDVDGESLRSMVGVSLAGTNQTGLGPATTQLRFGWLHEFLDDQQSGINAVQAVAPVDFLAQSADTGRDWLSLGAQLDWGFVLGGQFTLAYQGNLNSDSTFQSGMVGTRWIW
ncbi:autotransporter family protein [Rhodopirellula bahusiensis]|uniref:Serine protease n=1 Tax=Rhodopirellula bahusiensis TaxID=2014065 RepID=A0A2G1VZS1_9BACT|nr:autotransporter outer membrane beta-barrel domain-containing protein [Rhodopirellula bahusiensis]PHQ32282.1 serine protease [Rhodopirellula bahusiensis]